MKYWLISHPYLSTNRFSLSRFFHTDPRTACLGRSVALFRSPPEARPADPIRRAVYSQATSSTKSGWFCPTTIPALPVQSLPASFQASVGPVPVPKCKRQKRR